MARLIKVLLTHRQASDRLTGINRSKTRFPVFVCAVRLQVANVPVRNRCTAGVQVPPKLSVLVNYAERGNVVTSPCAIQGRPTVRQADEGAVLRGWKKQMPFCNGRDIPKIRDSVRRLKDGRCLRTRT